MGINKKLEEIEAILNKINNSNDLNETKTEVKILTEKFSEVKEYLLESEESKEVIDNSEKYNLDRNAIERLWKELKRIRYRIARENSISAWKVFNDKLLDEYLKILPMDKESFSKTSFFSEARYRQYGKEIVREIKEFIRFENDSELKKVEGFDKVLDKINFLGEKKISTNVEEMRHYSNTRNSNGAGIAHQGKMYSDKMQKEIMYDSELERKFMMILERSEKVKYYCAQPYDIRYRVVYEFNGKRFNEYKRYYPDFLIAFKDDTKALVEMKNYFHLVDIRSKMKYELLKKISEEQGVGYLISTNGKHTVEEAIEYNIDPEFEREILNKIRNKKSITYREFVNIRNKHKVKNYSLLPLAYKNNLFMYNNVISTLKVEDIVMGKIYTKMVF